MRRIDIGYVQIMLALDATGDHKASAAARLGISPATLRRRIKEERFPPYVWQPNIRRRLVTMVEADIAIDGLGRDHAPSALKMWKEVLRGEGINEPRRLSDRELKALDASWKGLPRYKWTTQPRSR